MSIDPISEIYSAKPFVDGAKVLCNGTIEDWSGTSKDITTPLIDMKSGQRMVIGRMAQMDFSTSQQVFQSSVSAWDNGNGTWPQLKATERINAVRNFVSELSHHRDEIIQTLMWEICKSASEATSEFDRTIKFIEDTIESLHKMDVENHREQVISDSTKSQVRRTAVGVVLVLGPFNYPFNETYSSLIPALLMGNVILMKLPGVGGLAHILTMHAFATCFPPGVVNFISGPGRVVISPVMESGLVDMISFVGSSRVADAIVRAHPHPHRLKLFLSLEGKNVGLVLPDADLESAVEQCVLGATSFNGQRCTAIKLIFVHASLMHVFLSALRSRVNLLKLGTPWDEQVNITPLPQEHKVEYLQGLIHDAEEQGAEVINAAEGGGQILLGSLMIPAIVSPINKSMRLWYEEQFGPVIPVAVYNDLSEVEDYLQHMSFGLQISLFTGKQVSLSTVRLVDMLSTSVGRININVQCSRSPDVLPFSGRRSSANGTLSVSESLKTFSIETVLATIASNEVNDAIFSELTQQCNFLSPVNLQDT